MGDLTYKRIPGETALQFEERVHGKLVPYDERPKEEQTLPTPTEYENTQLRAELDRMTAAVLSGGPFCRHCPRHNGKHNYDCPEPEARAIREKYGFDKKEQQ